ncbi:AEC family transporter [Sulfurimonas sp.]|jgi:malate permease and related proteins|uniref:AEC family transporter n=1 Tax=Sulfurimonas sp. TaxID=2022749 RepID=UPI0025FB0A48|nr:AEC family transporter [Sulfurimonas sp.]MBT5935723.1 AEC family transporter [Sulfurimonas sp.]
METFALIFVSIFTGYIINFKKIFAQNTPIILNQFILYISLPAMVFLQIPKLTFSFDIIIPVVISYGVMAFSALFIFYISKVLQFSREVTASLMLVGVLGNTSFVGIPVIQAYFGESALPYVLIYDQLGSFIVLSTYGTFISVYYSREDNVDVKAIAIKIITFPTFIALLTSLFFIGTTFHPVITSVLSSLASTIIPLALVSVGLQLKFKLPKEDMKPFAVAIGVKLLLAPVIAICIAYLFTWENTVADISIIESAMGPMITAGAVASMAGLSPRLSSAVVGYGTILSLLTSWMFFTVL